MKKIVFVIIVLLLVAAFFKVKYGYKNFIIKDVTRNDRIDYKTDQNGSFLKVKIKGKIDGKAIVSLRTCRGKGNSSELIDRFMSVSVRGTIDTTVSRDFYQNCLYADYAPVDVKSGDITVSILLR